MPEEITVKDLIRREAKTAGIPEELALAVAEQESGFNPGALNPKIVKGETGGAVGVFQFLPSTAKSRGFDPRDPVQNIRGGVGYLRELLDKHQGNVENVLKEYGGVVNDTTYVPGVVARFAKFRSPGVGTPPPDRPLRPLQTGQPAKPYTTARPEAFGGPTYGQRAADVTLGLMESFDPRTRTGRRNIAGATGGAAAIALTGGGATPAVLPFIAGATGAVGGGMLAETGEQIVGTAPPSRTDVLLAGAEQGAMELGGQAITWPVRALGRRFLASGLAKRTAERFHTNLERASEAIRGARESMAEAVSGARTRAGELLSGAQVAKEGMVETARAARETGVEAAKTAAERGVTTAQGQAAGLTGAVGERYAGLGTPPPGGATRAGRQAQAVITGPAKATRDVVGEQVEEAARQGPPVDITDLKAEAQRIIDQEIRPPQQAFPRVSPEEVSTGGANLGNMPTGTPAQRAQAEAALAALAAAQEQATQVTLQHPAMQTLGRIINAENVVPFEQAHLFKRELDDALSTAWDKVVKKRVESITQHLRGGLRQSLRGFAPYDAATRAYSEVVQGHTRGIWKETKRLMDVDPGSVVRAIKPGQDEKVKLFRDLLIEQSEMAGEGDMGRAAWDAIRSSWTHDKLTRGSLDGLADRLAKLSPEFTEVMYGDVQGRTVLQNLRLLSTAYQEALEAGEANIAKAVAAGKAGVRGAKEAGTELVRGAKQTGAGLVAGARTTGRAGVTAAERAGKAQVSEELGKKIAETREARRFVKSSLIRGSATDIIAETLKAVALGPGSTWGALATVKVLRGPRAADLLHYAALDSRRAQTLAKILTQPGMGTVASNFIRIAAKELNLNILPEPEVGVPPPVTPTNVQPRGLEAGLGPPP